MYKLDSLGVDYITWREPDIDNELTAIAIYGNCELFKNMRLL